MKLELDDSRRVTGKGYDWDHCGAIIDAFVGGVDKQKVIDVWQQKIKELLQHLGWQHQSIHARIFENGVSLFVSAPLDLLYAATEVNEAAWEDSCRVLMKQPPLTAFEKEDRVHQLKLSIQQQSNPLLLELIQQAEQKLVPWLADDDDFSLGYGKCSETWPITQLPEPEQLNWHQYQKIPIAMVTGTNGKSTTVRLTSLMVNLSGSNCGVTSTDFVKVGDVVLDKGDYSGPGGARMLLRHPETEIALLEVARGGLLRRGLPVPEVDIALITNIAEDHFGQYGINNLDALTKAKCIVSKAVPTDKESALLVLNADDKQLQKASINFPQTLAWFSLDNKNPFIDKHIQQGGIGCFVEQQKIVYYKENRATEVIAIDDIAMTFAGAAKHNISNAMGAICIARKLEVDWPFIRLALQKFNSNEQDNPGRGNIFKWHDSTVIIDFAHNTHSMDAMAEMVKNMSSSKKYLLVSAAGDRTDNEIKEMTNAAMKMQPDVLVIAEIEDYLRGRKRTEIPQIISQQAIKKGMDDAQIFVSTDPLTGAKMIFDQIKEKELALIMALTQREEISQLMSAHINLQD